MWSIILECLVAGLVMMVTLFAAGYFFNAPVLYMLRKIYRLLLEIENGQRNQLENK